MGAERATGAVEGERGHLWEGWEQLIPHWVQISLQPKANPTVKTKKGYPEDLRLKQTTGLPKSFMGANRIELFVVTDNP